MASAHLASSGLDRPFGSDFVLFLRVCWAVLKPILKAVRANLAKFDYSSSENIDFEGSSGELS